MYVVTRGCRGWLKVLWQHSKNANRTTKNGITAVMSDEMAAMLFANGTDIHGVNPINTDAMYEAFKHATIKLIKSGFA